MSRTDRIWSHAEAAFKAFAEADRLFSELPPNGSSKSTLTGKIHRLQFKARNAKERWRLFKKFFKITLGVLFTGKARLQFKDR